VNNEPRLHKRRSLTLRLVFYLVLAQIVALAFIPIGDFLVGYAGLAPQADMALRDWGEYRARALVTASLTPAAGDSPTFRPTQQLLDYIERNPAFRYAAFKSTAAGAPVDGSSGELLEALGSLRRIEAARLKFHIAGDPDATARGALRRVYTPFGIFAVAIYGYNFHWEDLGAAVIEFFPLHSILDLAPLFLGVAAITFGIVRQGLSPLRAAAADVGRIDMESLDQRIPDADVPAEIAPFVDAINLALARLDAGVAAQRRFTANAAHELRTPIAILRAHTDIPDDAAFRREMRRDIRRLQTIVEQLLITARISSRERGVQETFDLVETTLRLVADYAPLLIQNGRSIEFDPPSAPIFVRGNRWALECIVANLIANALRAEPVGGTVRVTVAASGELAVADNGAGVAPEDRERLFEPFWRRDDATPGAGLGLSISKELAELQGGSIGVDDSPSGGATFRVKLRLA
jgi:signal transduction histidine kinase